MQTYSHHCSYYSHFVRLDDSNNVIEFHVIARFLLPLNQSACFSSKSLANTRLNRLAHRRNHNVELLQTARSSRVKSLAALGQDTHRTGKL